jgi:predicted MFS family arabinose efflux permease
MKVTADALIQQSIADEYRGRVFAFYDVAVNLCIVTGALLAAIWVDDSGRSVVIPIAIPVGYLAMAAVFGRRSY